MQWGVPQVLGLLVHVLAFSDQLSDHVKITISGCWPDNSKSKLGVWVFANVEGYLVLAVDHISKFGICVSTPGQ